MSTVIPNSKVSILRNKAFTFLLTGHFLLNIGNKIYELALPLMIYEITKSSVAMGSMRTAELLPNLLFAIFIGILVDRVRKKNWVLWMIVSQFLLLIVLFILFKTETTLLPLYYFIGFLLMTFNYGYFNAQMSLTKLVVPTPLLTSANAKFSFAETFVGIMGPAISGLILMMAHLYDGILITAILYLSALLIFTQLKIEEVPFTQKKSTGFWSELKEGWSAFRSNHLLMSMTLFVIFLNCTMTVVNMSVIFLAKDEMGLESSTVALILSVAGIGGLIASLFMDFLRNRMRLGLLFGVSIFMSALSYFGMFVSHNIFILAISLLLNGFAITVYVVTSYTFRHEQTPAHLMGRMSGITGTLYRIGMPVSMYASGWFVEWWGTSSVFLIATLLNLILFFIYMRTKLHSVH